MPVQVRGEVLSLRRVGAYHQMTVVAPGIAEHARPGQFIAVAVGGAETAMLLRRAFSIYDVSERGVYGGTVDFVFAVTGKGTAWLASRHAYDAVDVVGPLGKPFKLPRDPARCLLVGGGYGTAPLFLLGKALAQRGCRIDFALGASTEERLFGALDAKRMATSLAVTTEDGTSGEKGLVSDLLPEMIVRNRVEVVYACGPMGMLRAVGDIAAEYEIPCQVAVEESMACGIGVCMTCVLPVVDDGGATRMVRSCIEGPVFASDRVRWSDIGTVPADAVGAYTTEAG